MMSRKFLVVSLLTAAFAWAQYDSADVLGTITDGTGASVPGARVTLENTQTGVKVDAQTDGSGNYLFLNQRIGQYKVVVEATGFKTSSSEAFMLRVSSRQRVNLKLEVGDVTQSVVVTEAAQLLESDSSDRGQVINRAAIVNLPLNGRAYADLALLSPGVRRSNISNRDASFNVNGLRSSLNNFLVDGVDNNAYGTSNQGFSNQVVQLNPDAVQEFKVQTNNYSAEYGRAGGAVINASLRSGTNEYHGAAWEFLRNTQLNAVGFFKPVAGIKPVLIQNQFGGAFGGPIKRDKMFFFANYEGFRRVTRGLQFSTLATPAQREGSFGVPIRNPYTNEIYSNGIVPASQITPFARRVFADLPAPNLPGIANNFQALPSNPTTDNKGDVRYDHYLSSKLNVFARYSHRLNETFEAAGIPGPSGGNSNGNFRVLNQQLATGFNYNLSPSSLIDFRIGIGLTEGGKTPVGAGGATVRELYGITGLPEDSTIGAGLTAQNLGGYSQLGRQSSNPQFQNPFVVNPKVNYSKIVGRHSFKAGYEYQSISTEIDDFNPKSGSDTYNGQFSRPVGAAANNIFNIADFLLGARSRYELNNVVIVNLRQTMNFFYFQDDWKVNSRLTINAGVRYEFATPQWERDGKLSNFDPSTNTVIQAKQDGSLSERTLVNPDRNNWAPRIGFALQVSPKTVIRSGYGVSYIHFNRLGGENLLSYNGPTVVNPAVDQDPSRLPLCTATANPFTCFRPTQLGYPENFAGPQNYNPMNVRTNHIPKGLRTGYLQTWHFSIQRELVRDLLIDVGYVGNKSDKLMILGDFNQARPNNVGENLSLQARRPISNFNFIQIAFDGGIANYHGLQLKVEKRYSGGFYLINSFTWSKAIDNAAGHLETFNGDNSRVNFRDIRNERGLSSYNQPLNNTTTFVWEMPFGKGRRFGSDMHSALNFIAGGWRLSGINTATSGQPINLRYSPTSQFQVSGAPTYRPNIIGTATLPESESNIDNYFSRTNVVIPTDVSRPFGNVGRNTERSHAIYNFDFGMHKEFALPWEGKRIEFRSEFFNLLNKTNFGAANGDRSSGGFSTIRSLSTPARQIQFALKLVF